MWSVQRTRNIERLRRYKVRRDGPQQVGDFLYAWIKFIYTVFCALLIFSLFEFELIKADPFSSLYPFIGGTFLWPNFPWWAGNFLSAEIWEHFNTTRQKLESEGNTFGNRRKDFFPLILVSFLLNDASTFCRSTFCYFYILLCSTFCRVYFCRSTFCRSTFQTSTFCRSTSFPTI